MKKKRRKYIFQTPEEVADTEEVGKEIDELLPGQTYSLHNDDRKTMVEVDGKLYDLVLSKISIRDLRKEKFKNIPHVRRLNPILQRSSESQAFRNDEAKVIHKLASQCSYRSDKVTSIKKAMALGANVPEVINKLMKEKEAALKVGDQDQAKKIRKQLRSLDYKRYLNEEK